LALNVNIGLADAAAYYAANLNATYFDSPYNHSNDNTPKRLYTVVNCITDSTNTNTYFKQFAKLD
jgi:hypothetical protein